MPSGLHRTYGAHHLHFITCSCYRRLPFLGSAPARNQFLATLEQTRQRFRFVIVGYVVMPEHIHLLVTEPEVGTPSTVMVESPEQWRWSSYLFYLLGETGPVRVNQGWTEISFATG